MHFPGLPRRSLQAQGQAQTQGQNQERNQEQNQEQKQLHTSRLSLSKFHTPQSHSSSKRIRSCFSLPLIVILACLLPTLTTAWPYVDCSGSSPIFSLTSVTTHFDPTAESINLVLQGNFSNLYQYPAAETSQWRTSIVTTILGTMLHRSEGPACEMITGDCPTASGPGLISTVGDHQELFFFSIHPSPMLTK
ncbi:hypothetical protein BCR41DRAFT_232303 [Lobosporangium transversale]|uniref:Uncharacterized protein n=1 Tax=Lobosporangium transversale TaxID=64571 RepID=A0A1Y2G5X6_9FUNG|nr:hypothetical protein BCR41DRAFT_232303 [Lobosporangium transversale]ORY96065.1 hypothetical protein BCR41DRAFT_232303 [Lobosporangium transversale]|eukprot:XP_021875492.1 hypothetical protein BCR41DRAFT_232303 [Lobosporangium transversale]